MEPEREVNVELVVDYAGFDKYGVWNTYTAKRIGLFATLDDAIRYAEERAEEGLANQVWDNAFVTLSPLCHGLAFNEYDIE